MPRNHEALARDHTVGPREVDPDAEVFLCHELVDPHLSRATGIAAIRKVAPYRELTRQFGEPLFERIDAAASPAQKKRLAQLTPDRVKSAELAGEKIQSILTRAPGNDASIGGLKVIAEHGWFAARPSGTEDVYKIYAESRRGAEHLRQIQQEAQSIVTAALA